MKLKYLSTLLLIAVALTSCDSFGPSVYYTYANATSNTITVNVHTSGNIGDFSIAPGEEQSFEYPSSGFGREIANPFGSSSLTDYVIISNGIVTFTRQSHKGYYNGKNIFYLWQYTLVGNTEEYVYYKYTFTNADFENTFPWE